MRERGGGGGEEEDEEEERAELVVLRALLGRWSAIVLFVSSQSSFWRAISSPCTPTARPSPPRLVLQRHTMEPGQLSNMRNLLAVLVAQAPPSCWLNDVAPRTVAEAEVDRVRAHRHAQHEGSDNDRAVRTHRAHLMDLAHVPLRQVAVERPGPADCCGGGGGRGGEGRHEVHSARGEWQESMTYTWPPCS